MTEKDFRPYPEPEDYEEFEDYLEDLYNEDENSEETYQEIEDEIVGEELEGYWDKEEDGAKITIYPWIKDPNGYYWLNIPNCCRNCPNHPSNGGSGVCLCTLPDFEQQTYPPVYISSQWTDSKEQPSYITTVGGTLDNIVYKVE